MIKGQKPNNNWNVVKASQWRYGTEIVLYLELLIKLQKFLSADTSRHQVIDMSNEGHNKGNKLTAIRRSHFRLKSPSTL